MIHLHSISMLVTPKYNLTRSCQMEKSQLDIKSSVISDICYHRGIFGEKCTHMMIDEGDTF